MFCTAGNTERQKNIQGISWLRSDLLFWFALKEVLFRTTVYNFTIHLNRFFFKMLFSFKDLYFHLVLLEFAGWHLLATAGTMNHTNVPLQLLFSVQTSMANIFYKAHLSGPWGMEFRN